MAYRFVAVDDAFQLPDPVKAELTQQFDDRYETKTGLEPTTKLLTWTAGGLDQVVALSSTSRGSCGMRVPVRVAEPTSRWRIKMRHYGVSSGAKTPMTGPKIIYGPMVGDGNFESTATLVDSTFTIPGDGSFFYSPWVTAPDSQLGPNRTMLIGTGFDVSPNQSVQGQEVKWWFTNTSAQAVDPTYRSQSIQNMYGLPTDFQVEYESTSTRLSGLWIGDSISAGIVGPPGVSQNSNVLQYWDQSYPNLWASQNNAQLNNVSGSGFLARTYADNMDTWTRVDHPGAAYDFGVVALGTNDFMNVTLAEFQASMATVFERMRTLCGLEGKPIWLISPTARGQGKDSVRIQMHNWLATKPLGAAGFVDLQTAIAATLESTSYTSGYTSDGVHPSYEGRDRMLSRVVRDMKFGRAIAPTVRNNDLFGTYTQAQYDALGSGADPNKLYLIRG